MGDVRVTESGKVDELLKEVREATRSLAKSTRGQVVATIAQNNFNGSHFVLGECASLVRGDHVDRT